MRPEYVAPAPRLTLAGARAALDAALAHAADLGVRVVVVVADPAGDPIVMARADGAFKFSAEVAQKKAFTAATSGASTAAMAADFVTSPTLLHVLTPGIDDLMPVGGGVPIVSDGSVVGAVGVSGATERQDHQIAEAGAAAVA